MHKLKVAAFAIVFAQVGLASSTVFAASECPASGSLSDWGTNSTGYFSVASGGSCLFPIRIAGEMQSSKIAQKPAHGTLKRMNVSTYVYTAKGGYKGPDVFAVQATGKGPTSRGTSVITMNATVQ